MKNPLLIRAVSLYFPLTIVFIICAVRPPTKRQISAAIIAMLWALPALFVLQLLNLQLGWWTYNVEQAVFLGKPTDAYLSWAILWGAFPLFTFPRLRLPGVVVLMLVLDLLLMPLAAPLVVLEKAWVLGECVGIAIVLIPAQLLGRWTMAQKNVQARVALLAIAYGSLVFVLLPTVIIEQMGLLHRWPQLAILHISPLGWQVVGSYSRLQNVTIIELLAIPLGLGLSAVAEFAVRGKGTPLPFDPPQHLVTSGLYRYVANPMQVSTALVFIGLGLWLQNVLVLGCSGMIFIYGIGFAAWSEGDDMVQRYGEAWQLYRQQVGDWLPNWRPFIAENRPKATLYVQQSCGACSTIGRWFSSRVVGMEVSSAENHPTQTLTRITYQQGRYSVTGVRAIGRALEHTNLAWAILGALIRLPLVSHSIQLLVDASGGEPRQCPTAKETTH